jgi:6-pyruvoyltetrahydropterin/6-carboxytetrahydropterin synthase
VIELSITIEWDMAHRLPNHKTKCRNIHGHRYRLEVILAGTVNKSAGNAEEGMLVDFSQLKSWATNEVVERLDHACVFNDQDPLLSVLCQADPSLKLVATTFVPTAEELVGWLAGLLRDSLIIQFPWVKLVKCILWETPTNSAIWRCSFE